MRATRKVNRRDLLRAGAVCATGLVIGFFLPATAGRPASPRPPGRFAPNAWLGIDTDDQVTVFVDRSEMGQGVMTSLPVLIAEELEADWSTIRVEFAPADPVYVNPLMLGLQATGGSASIRASWEPLRKVGATAREMLVAAAARMWGVDPLECHAENGAVIHRLSKRRLSYGSLVDVAAGLPVPDDVRLKDPVDFRLIGKHQQRLDTPGKVAGSTVFAVDVKLPGMLYASVDRCPVFGGKVTEFSAAETQSIEGVREVVSISSGIAVVADSSWAAMQGRQALQITWDEGPNGKLSSAAISQTLQHGAKQPGAVVRHDGDTTYALEGAAKKLEASYELPFEAHATMEPMNCTADVRNDRCEIWVGTQNQTGVFERAVKITGLPGESVKVHTALMGGGFGRRFELDFVTEALEVSKSIAAPVQVLWTREDDMQHDFYRPATYGYLRAGLDQDGWPVAWRQRVVSPSIMSRDFSHFVQDGIDPSAVEGLADLPYAIANIHIDYVMADLGIPVGFWRSVSRSQNAFMIESFVDEIATAGGKDPYELRRKLLDEFPRQKAVLELAAGKADWGQPPPADRHRGIALHEHNGSPTAQVVEISVGEDGTIEVHRVVCAIDCGIVVDPDTVEAQVEGSIVYGLTAVLHGGITIENGRVKQSNFHDYPMLRLHETPEIEVHIMPSTAPPTGAGEAAVPPLAPALVNAVFAATSNRMRRLPIDANELRST